MTFTTNQKHLSSALQQLQRVVASKTNMPILQDIVFNAHDNELRLVASDLEHEASIYIGAEVSQSGCVCIDARRITELVKRLQGDITFSVADGKVTLKTETGKYSLACESADEFPKGGVTGDVTEFDLPTDVLLDGISRSLFATANDELRHVMNGICFDITQDAIVFAASDGHKLVRYTKPMQTGIEQRVLVGTKSASLIRNLFAKSANVHIAVGTNSAQFTADGVQLWFRLIEGRYPNYNAVIPQTAEHEAIVSRLGLMQSLDRVSLMANSSSNLIRLQFSNGTLKVCAEDYDFSTEATESMPCECDFDLEIGFKGNTLQDMLSNIDTEKVRVKMTDASRAGVFEPLEQADGEFTGLIMPMLLS